MSSFGLADAALMERLTAMIERADVALFKRQINALLTRPDAGPGLPRIEAPTHVMVGRQDGWSPVEQHREMAARIPNAELVVIEDCGHMSLVEQPQAVAAALVRWIQAPRPEALAQDLNPIRYARA